MKWKNQDLGECRDFIDALEKRVAALEKAAPKKAAPKKSASKK